MLHIVVDSELQHENLSSLLLMFIYENRVPVPQYEFHRKWTQPHRHEQNQKQFGKEPYRFCLR